MSGCDFSSPALRRCRASLVLPRGIVRWLGRSRSEVGRRERRLRGGGEGKRGGRSGHIDDCKRGKGCQFDPLFVPAVMLACEDDRSTAPVSRRIPPTARTPSPSWWRGSR